MTRRLVTRFWTLLLAAAFCPAASAEVRLATEYNPTTEEIRYQTINGRPPHTPILEATDLPLAHVPFVPRNDSLPH